MELHTFTWSSHLQDNRDCKIPRSVMICPNSIILSIRSRFLSHQIHCNNNRSILIYVLSPRIIGFFIIWKRNLQKLHMILRDLLPSMARNALSWYATKMRKSSLVIILQYTPKLVSKARGSMANAQVDSWLPNWDLVASTTRGTSHDPTSYLANWREWCKF